jgi:hypothetical protein
MTPYQIFNACSNCKSLAMKWNLALRTHCGILHTYIHKLFQRNKIQQIQYRCNAHCSSQNESYMMIINFVEYKCSQVVFSIQCLWAYMVNAFNKILLSWQPYHMVYLSNLMQVSAQEDFITYEHVTSFFPTAHLTVNLQYYEISSHVVATALEVMCKYKYCRGVFRCNSDPPNIKFNPSMLALLPV